MKKHFYLISVLSLFFISFISRPTPSKITFDNQTFKIDYHNDAQNLPEFGFRAWSSIYERNHLIALLAHVEKDGRHLLALSAGDVLKIHWSNNHSTTFFVNRIDTWQDVGRWKRFYSSKYNQTLTSSQLFEKYYKNNSSQLHLVLQTCTLDNAGVVFVIANIKSGGISGRRYR